MTDHKPLEIIYSRTSKPSARIERWVLRLQPNDFKVRYTPGTTNIADALSRMPVHSADDEFTTLLTEESVRFVTKTAVPNALTAQQVEQASRIDPELCNIRKCLESGQLDSLPKPFLGVRHELTYVGCVVIRGTRIVPPASLRDRILELAHEGHQGIVKTKERLRTKVWWPGIDRQAELKCKTCHGCKIVSQLAAPPPVKSTPLPSSPWEHLAADLLGPLPTGESLLVAVDYYSRYFEVDILHSTTSKVIISRLRTQFARHGIPHSLRTDNGPEFVSDEFRQFLSEIGIQHRRNTPLWPLATGEVERQNRTLLKTLKIAHAEQKNWNIELQRFLLAYRTTPHTTTGESPSNLLFGRDIRSKLPDLALFNENPNQPSAVRDNDSARKQAAKDRSDSRFNAKERDLKPGDKYTISPGSWGSMAKSRPATAARGPQARGLPWRAEMQPNCPGYQERLCLSSWNRYSTRTGKARKNRTRKESFLARKNDRNFQPCEIANIRPRAEICNLTWLESAHSVLAKQVPVQSSKVHVRSQNLATFIRRSDWSVPWLQTCDI